MRCLSPAFTLIELLIAIAIISILTAVAIPQYQSHTSRSALMACYKEILNAQPGFEFTLATTGAISENWLQRSETALSPLQVPHARACSEHILTSAAIEGVVAGSPAVNGVVVSLQRQADTGIWYCRLRNLPAGTDPALFPRGCETAPV